MSTQQYTVLHFRNKFAAIPEEKWYVGAYHNPSLTQFCALGHCGARQGMGWWQYADVGTEARALLDLFWNSPLRPHAGAVGSPTVINDGKDERYQQPHPRDRMLAALDEIIANEQQP